MAKFCRYCGSPVQEGVKFCPECGKQLAGEIKTQQPQKAPDPQPAYQPRQAPVQQPQRQPYQPQASVRQPQNQPYPPQASVRQSQNQPYQPQAPVQQPQRQPYQPPQAPVRQTVQSAVGQAASPIRQAANGFGVLSGVNALPAAGEFPLDLPGFSAPSAQSGGVPGFVKFLISIAAGGISIPVLNQLGSPWSFLIGAAVSVLLIVVSSKIKKSRGSAK